MLDFKALLGRLLSAAGQSRRGKTIEIFGWVILAESTVMLFAPGLVTSLLGLPAPTEWAANYFRLVALLVGGLGMLYVVSGRLDAEGFAFASLLDRPLVPLVTGVLWYMNLLPGSLALAFSAQDFGGFLWTLLVWRAESASKAATVPGGSARAS